MHLLTGNAIERMRAWEGEPPQVIYLDPMFPHRDKSALVKKEMRVFRPLVGDDRCAGVVGGGVGVGFPPGCGQAATQGAHYRWARRATVWREIESV